MPNKSFKQFLGFAVLQSKNYLISHLNFRDLKNFAYELKISERTVKAHRKQVFDKVGVASIADLVRLTEKAGIKPADVSF